MESTGGLYEESIFQTICCVGVKLIPLIEDIEPWVRNDQLEPLAYEGLGSLFLQQVNKTESTSRKMDVTFFIYPKTTRI